MRADLSTALSVAILVTVLCVAALRLVDRNEKEPIWALVIFLWLGMVAAAAASIVAGVSPGEETGVTISLAAEVAKTGAIGLGFALMGAFARLRRWEDANGPFDGLLYGSAAGMGLAIGDFFLRETLIAYGEAQIPNDMG